MTYRIGKHVTVADSTGTIGELIELGAPEIGITELQTTTHGSSEWHTFAAGLKNGGTISLKVLYNPTDSDSNGFDRLYARAIGDASLNTDTYTITFPSDDPEGLTMIFTGVIVGVPIETPLDDNITMTFNIKVSGAITGTLGA